MRRVLTLYQTTVGKKVVMAATGIVLFGFIVVHMVGNLKAFEGAGATDNYALFLREFGYPAIPEHGALWAVRLVLLAAVLAHIHAAVTLWAASRKARRVQYRKEESQVFSYASRTMRWGGVIVAVFVVYHLLHFTTGTVHPEFEHGAAYANLVTGFQSPIVVAFYLIAVGALCLHLYHGLWSVFTTFGNENPRIERVRRPLAAVVALVLFVGYAIVPLAVQVGILTVE